MRRNRLVTAALTAVVVAGAATGCSSARRAAAPLSSTSDGRPPPVPASASTSTPPAPPRPTTTTTVVVPPLPVPPPVTPLVSPPQPGEGAWLPSGDRLRRGYAIYTTALRPAAGYPAAGVAWIDTAATRVALYAGYAEPYGSWPLQAAVATSRQPSLMAAFNSGFKIYSYDTGWYDSAHAAVPLQAGAASLVIFANGTATVADWGRDVTLGPDVAAVRQNLTLLVDHGVVTPQAGAFGLWGAVLGGGVTTWRSGVGVTAAGDLLYVGGSGLDPVSLARLLVAAGAVRAMELDINPQWVSFSSFTHVGGIGGATATGANLVAGMYYGPDHYLQPYSRDFFAVFARSARARVRAAGLVSGRS